MSAKDMVSYMDGKDESSYLGPNYTLKLWDHDIDKPRIAAFHNDIKPRHYMDSYMKSKKRNSWAWSLSNFQDSFYF